VSFSEALPIHANAQAHSIKLQASAEHNTGMGQMLKLRKNRVLHKTINRLERQRNEKKKLLG